MPKAIENKPESEVPKEAPTDFPCSIEEYCQTAKLDPFTSKVFKKIMSIEVGPHVKFLHKEWEDKKKEYYSRVIK